MTSEITISEVLFHLIREHANDRYRLQLVLFFADHPYTQFNELAIVHALNQDGGRRYLLKALSDLVDKGMIRTCTATNGVIYSLHENMRCLVSELAKLDVCQRQLLLRQTCPDFVKKGSSMFGSSMATRVLSQIPDTAVAGRQNCVIFNQEEKLNENMLPTCSKINPRPVANAASNL